MSTSTVPPPGPAGLDRRFLAFTVDRVVLLGPGVAAGIGASAAGLSTGASTGVGLAVLLVVWTIQVALVAVRGTSPGKQLAGLAVQRHDDPSRPVGWGRAAKRCLVLGPAGILTGGFAWLALAWTALVDGSGLRRGWHDRVAGTVVVDVRAAQVVPVPESAADAGAQGVVNLTTMRLLPAPSTPLPAGAGSRPLSGSDPGASLPLVPPVAEEPEPRTVIRSVRSQPRVPAQHQPTATWFVEFDGLGEFEVTGLVLIGRNPQPRPGEPVAHLVPLASADMSVSKTHAHVVLASDGVLVALDRGSTNGSVLVRQGINKPLVAGRGTTLRDGDRVRFGDREMRVRRG